MSEHASLKKELREKIFAQREAVSEKLRRQAARDVCEQFMGHIPLRPSNDIIAGYWPIKGELDVTLLLETLSDNHQLALPVIQEKDKPLAFRSYTWDDALITHTHYPTKEPLPSAALVTPTLLIIPLVAFDKKGYRLGMGGGFYDRTLAALRARDSELLAVGVGYSFQQVAALPHEPHDMTLDCVVTEKGVKVP